MRGVGALSAGGAAPRPRCAAAGANDSVTMAAAMTTPPIKRAFMLVLRADYSMLTSHGPPLISCAAVAGCQCLLARFARRRRLGSARSAENIRCEHACPH